MVTVNPGFQDIGRRNELVEFQYRCPNQEIGVAPQFPNPRLSASPREQQCMLTGPTTENRIKTQYLW